MSWLSAGGLRGVPRPSSPSDFPLLPERRRQAVPRGSASSGIQGVEHNQEADMRASDARSKLGVTGGAQGALDAGVAREGRDTPGRQVGDGGKVDRPSGERSERSAVEDSAAEVEGPRRGPYYEPVGELHALPDDLPSGTVVGGEGAFGLY